LYLDDDVLMSQKQEQTETLVERVYWVLFEADFELAELILAVPLLGWGLVLLLPGSSFATSPTLRFLSPYENLLGAWCVALCLFKASTAFLKQVRSHAVVMFLISIWWTYIAVAILIRSPLSTGTPAYLGLAIGQAWLFLRYVARHDLFERPHDQ
jgi:hypothetical protein